MNPWDRLGKFLEGRKDGVKMNQEVCKHGLGIVHNCYICGLEKERDRYKVALEKIKLFDHRHCNRGEDDPVYLAEKALEG